MKIAVVGFYQLRTMQYLNRFTDLLDENSIDYDVIHWSRSDDDIQPEFKGNHIVFNYRMVTEQSFFRKIIGFIKYSAFLHKVLLKGNYDKVIVLASQTAISILDVLLFKFRKKYIYAYYDITKEKILLYKKLILLLLAYSEFSTISSKGFLHKLGIKKNNNILLIHNTQRSFRTNTKGIKTSMSSDDPIKIVYWGIIRQVKFNKLVCDLFGNDHRFVLYFHGEGSYNDLELYCASKGYKNIFFTGKYNRDSIETFVNNTDILNCLYDNDDEMQPALQVKLYDALHYRLPILVNKGSYVSEYAKELNGLLKIEVSNASKDDIYKWYRSLKITTINESYEQFEEIIQNDEEEFIKVFKKFLKDN